MLKSFPSYIPFAVLAVKCEVKLIVYLLQADVLTVKNAVSSAVDIMQAMGSSVCNLLTKVKVKGLFMLLLHDNWQLR
jgi:hypothetical protein